MTALIAALRTDARVLYRTGYVQATLVVLIALIVLALQISRIDFAGFADLVAAVILVDVVVAPVFLTGLMILLERSDGSLAALSASPMSAWTYLASKTITISAVCSLEMIVLVLVAYDGSLSAPLLIAALFAIASIATLLAVPAVAPFDTIFRFILPMIAWVVVLSVPAYMVLFDWRPGWMAVHPMFAPMTLLEAAFADISTRNLAFGAAGTTAWLAGAAWAARRAVRSLQLRTAGG